MTAVQIVEVGARDGLQNEPDIVSTADKLGLISRMIDAGVRRIEVASFVNPKRVPQMGGAEDVLAAVTPGEGLTRAALVLNDRGYERLRATSCEEVHVAFCVTETFNQGNQGRSVQDSLQQARNIVTAAHEDGRRATVAFAEDWREDAARRDFTINALYADPHTLEVFDYFDGLADLATRRPVELHRGRVTDELAGRRLAVTFAPVPGFRRRCEALAPAVVHPWRWLFRPRAGRMQSYSAWRKGMPTRPDGVEAAA